MYLAYGRLFWKGDSLPKHILLFFGKRLVIYVPHTNDVHNAFKNTNLLSQYECQMK